MALLLYRLPGERVMTIPLINHRGSVPTTGLRGMKIAIYLTLNDKVVHCLLLAYMDFIVDKLH